eukprot:355050-Chlamydomonas_euryale.AAC.5
MAAPCPHCARAWPHHVPLSPHTTLPCHLQSLFGAAQAYSDAKRVWAPGGAQPTLSDVPQLAALYREAGARLLRLRELLRALRGVFGPLLKVRFAGLVGRAHPHTQAWWDEHIPTHRTLVSVQRGGAAVGQYLGGTVLGYASA